MADQTDQLLANEYGKPRSLRYEDLPSDVRQGVNDLYPRKHSWDMNLQEYHEWLRSATPKELNDDADAIERHLGKPELAPPLHEPSREIQTPWEHPPPSPPEPPSTGSTRTPPSEPRTRQGDDARIPGDRGPTQEYKGFVSGGLIQNPQSRIDRDLAPLEELFTPSDLERYLNHRVDQGEEWSSPSWKPAEADPDADPGMPIIDPDALINGKPVAEQRMPHKGPGGAVVTQPPSRAPDWEAQHPFWVQNDPIANYTGTKARRESADFLDRENRRKAQAEANQIIELLHRIRDSRSEFGRQMGDVTGKGDVGRFADPVMAFYAHGPDSGSPTDIGI